MRFDAQGDPPADELERIEGALAGAMGDEPASLVVTPGLIGLNLAVFAVMVAAGVSPTDPTTEELLAWGADFGYVTTAGEWWRLLTAAFVHIGAIHLGVNLYALHALGGMAERLFGRVPFVVVYLVAAVGGSAASIIWRPEVVGAGASGAIFGVAGSLFAFFYLRRRMISPVVLQRVMPSGLAFLAYNALFGLTIDGIDNAAHLGGLVCGAVAGAAVCPVLSPDAPPRRRPAWRVWPALVLVGLLLPVAYARSGAGRALREPWERAMAHYDAGDYAAAAEQLGLYLEQAPDDPGGLYLRGVCRAMTGDLAGAESDLSRVVELVRDNGEAYRMRTWVRLARGDHEGAVADADAAIRAGSSSASVYIWRAQARARLGEVARAVVDADRAVELDPSADVHMGRAFIRRLSGDSEGALADYDRAVALAPESAIAYNNRAWHRFLTGDHRKGLADADRAIELDPAYANAVGTRAWLRFRLGEIDAALADAASAVALHGKPGAWECDRGLIFFLQAQPRLAIADWEAAVARDPANASELGPWIERARVLAESLERAHGLR